MSPDELARVREKLARSALGRQLVNEREAEVLAAPESFRLHRRRGAEVLRAEVGDVLSLRAVLVDLTPVERAATVIYAVRGDRDAIVTRDELQRLLATAA